MFLSCLRARRFFVRFFPSYIRAWTDTSRASGRVFEPVEGDLTAHVTDRREPTKLHIEFRLIWTLVQDRKSTKITTPRAACLKNEGWTDILKTKTCAKQAEKETERKQAEKETECKCLWQKPEPKRPESDMAVQ